MPSLRNTSSKGPLYLLSRSRIRNRTPWSEKSRPRLRACWVTQWPLGLAVQPASQTRRLPCAMKNNASQEHALDGEEIAGNDARSLRSQKLAPGRTSAPLGRLQRRAGEQPADA